MQNFRCFGGFGLYCYLTYNRAGFGLVLGWFWAVGWLWVGCAHSKIKALAWRARAVFCCIFAVRYFVAASIALIITTPARARAATNNGLANVIVGCSTMFFTF
jgi:hypothetical protein